ncbi:MAG: Ppx/GppA phosphatase family protein [Thermodesulfobacteriota bacterium]
MRTASIDIGTNTIRLLICDQSQDGELNKLYIDRQITRLGEGFSKDIRQITQKSMNRSILALKAFADLINKYNVEKTRAVATSVVREAQNGSEFTQRAENEAGIKVEVISGDEEAELTVLGVLNSISKEPDECLIFDIGGGSTEFVLIQKGIIVNQTSTPLGVVHMTEQYLSKELETPEEITELTAIIKNILDKELSDFESTNSNLTIIGTAGTPTTLAAIELGLVKYKPELINDHILSRSKTEIILNKLLKVPINKRSQMPGLETGREDIIITGTLILLQTLEKFSSDELIVSDGGVLEGIAQSQIAKLSKK